MSNSYNWLSTSELRERLLICSELEHLRFMREVVDSRSHSQRLARRIHKASITREDTCKSKKNEAWYVKEENESMI